MCDAIDVSAHGKSNSQLMPMQGRGHDARGVLHAIILTKSVNTCSNGNINHELSFRGEYRQLAA